MADPELLSLRCQVALLCARELELTRQLARMESPPWGQAVDALNDHILAKQTGGRAKAEKALAHLQEVIRRGADPAAAYDATWAELRAIMQERAKLAVAEHRRLETVRAYVTVEELVGVLVGMLEVVRANVEDMRVRQVIQVKFNELIEAHTIAKPVELFNGETTSY